MGALCVDQQTVLDNQRKQDVVLHAIYASVEVAVRRAARGQRKGRSMLFDEMCAIQAAPATIPFPRVKDTPATAGSRNTQSCVVKHEEAGSRTIDTYVCDHCSFCSADRPDIVMAGQSGQLLACVRERTRISGCSC